MDFIINANKITGKIKPVNGVCNGPSKLTEKYFEKAKIPFSRLHDMRLDFHDICDVPAIFKDFDADENSPESYDFVLSDAYIKRIKDCGTDIIYRLGSSMEMGEFRFGNNPPKDYLKWARICEHIIMHFNEGWTNGAYLGIKYFEIWNEPDGLNPNRAMDGQWTGTPREFYEFYTVVSKYLKNRFPSLNFGGYASCNVTSDGRREFFEGFLDYASKNAVPLDFFSWHGYASDTKVLSEKTEFVRAGLDKYGYTKTKQICTEWNYFWQKSGLWAEFALDGGEHLFEELFTEASGNIGAAYTLSAMITFQKSEVIAATLHRADALSMYCTIFNIYGVPQKQYSAFLAFSELKALGNEVEMLGGCDGVYACASSDGENVCVAVAQYNGKQRDYTFDIEGLDASAEYVLEKFETDSIRNYELVFSQTGTPDKLNFRTYLKSGSILLMKLKKDKK